MTQSRKFQYAVIVALTAVYVVLRLWRLTDSCLWFDEIFSVHAAEHSWNSILNFVALDLIHPPLFYVLLKLWIGVGSESVFWLRLLPVIFSIIAIFPFIAFCRELKLTFWTQALALFLLAVNGSLIKYAQEARMYSLLMCLSLFSMWLFARYFNRGKNFVPLLIVNVFLVYTHYFGWFVVASEVVAILVFQRIIWRRIATMFAIVLATFLPWMIAVYQAASSGSDLGQNIGWMARPNVREIIVFIFDLIEPFYSQAASSEPASIYRVSIPILLIVIVTWIAYLLTWKNRTDDERRTILLLLVFIKLPVIITFIASWLLPYSVWGTRHLIIVFPLLAIFTATTLFCLLNFKLKTASVSLLFLFTGYAFFITCHRPQTYYSWCAFEPLISQAATQKSEKIYVLEDLVAYHVWFALRNNPSVKVAKIANFDGVVEDKAYFLPRSFNEIEIADFRGVKDPQIWIAFRESSIFISSPMNSLNKSSVDVVAEFEHKGYVVTDRRMARGGQAVYFVKMQKKID